MIALSSPTSRHKRIRESNDNALMSAIRIGGRGMCHSESHAWMEGNGLLSSCRGSRCRRSVCLNSVERKRTAKKQRSTDSKSKTKARLESKGSCDLFRPSIPLFSQSGNKRSSCQAIPALPQKAGDPVIRYEVSLEIDVEKCSLISRPCEDDVRSDSTIRDQGTRLVSPQRDSISLFLDLRSQAIRTISTCTPRNKVT